MATEGLSAEQAESYRSAHSVLMNDLLGDKEVAEDEQYARDRLEQTAAILLTRISPESILMSTSPREAIRKQLQALAASAPPEIIAYATGIAGFENPAGELPPHKVMEQIGIDGSPREMLQFLAHDANMTPTQRAVYDLLAPQA